MKKGDKLYCKKSYNVDWIVRNNFYYILDIIHNSITGEVCGYFMSKYPDYRSGSKFSLDRDDLYIWYYFYTEKELRKLKLKELEDRR